MLPDHQTDPDRQPVDYPARLNRPAAGRGRRHVLVGQGGDEWGTPSVAVWHADGLGRPLAGWVFAAARAYREPTTAGRLLDAAARGLLVTGAGEAPRDGATAVLAGLRRAAGVPSHAGRRAILDLRRVVQDLTAERYRYATSFEDCADPAAGSDPADEPVVDRLLSTAGLLRRCAERWQAMESDRCSVPSGRATFGPPRALPPYWARMLDLAGQCHPIRVAPQRSTSDG